MKQMISQIENLNDQNVLSIELNEDKDVVLFLEECDSFFHVAMDKSELDQFIMELQEIQHQMI
jgi:hypothetical protein